jgi:hypothetical protein
MKNYDMLWSKDPKWFHYENLFPVIHEDAPEEVKKSFQNYLQELRDNYAEKK